MTLRPDTASSVARAAPTALLSSHDTPKSGTSAILTKVLANSAPG